MILWLLSFIPTETVFVLLAVSVLMYFYSEVVSSRVPSVSAATVRLIAIGLTVFSVFFFGVLITDKEMSAELKKSQAEVTRINENAKVITDKIKNDYETKLKNIKEKNVIVKEYITTKNDATCTLNNSFVELHDSAAKNEVPDSSRATDETPSTVKLSEAEAVIFDNYNKYNQVAQQLESLQQWVTEQQENNK